ncbi:BspA family leucine-rich repeat surface protein [Flavobacteriaceae bacterium]|nr:BspA family leucine-rich repeat surface protein [Flavobacteriaceae bacterium]
MKTITFLLIFSFSISTLLAQDFYLNSNGVTCMCPDAAVGDTGVVNGITYTKRIIDQITTTNATTTCTSGITEMYNIFEPSFNQDISSWDVSSVTYMNSMFAGTDFNQDISNWDVSNVTDMSGMFQSASFNQFIGDWDVSNVTYMLNMFDSNVSFNQPIGDWDVSNVTNMGYMFFDSSFNQPIGNWDVIDVTNMENMFALTDFNQDISNWDVSSVTYMNDMFFDSSFFNQDISNWQFNADVNLTSFITLSGLDINNYDSLLAAFSNQNLLDKELNALNLTYCNVSARDDLITNKGWTITDDTYSSPSIIAPNNIDIAADPISCVAANVELGTPTVDACIIDSVTNNGPTEFPIGETTVIWTLVDGSGIEVTDTQLVTVTLQVDIADVCYVSSDQTQVTNNRIYITTDVDNSGINVAYYEVLREAPSGAYENIGFINPPEVSFLDIDSDNTTQAYRYKIQTTDVCGASYPDSSFHKTILLQSGIASDNSINLSWTPYLGLDFSTYNIYKNTNGTGYELLTSLSFNNTTYNDTAANVLDNAYEYYIAIEAPGCNTDPLMTEFIKSNLEYVNPNLGSNDLTYLENAISLFPNPTSSQLSINTSNDIEVINLKLYNVLGQQITIVTNNTIELSFLPAGLYYLEIDTNLGTVTKTVIRK